VSAHDYWSDLAEAEQVGVPTELPIVVRRTNSRYECVVGGVIVTGATEEACWLKVREARPLPGVCKSCLREHRFGDCSVSGPSHLGNGSRPNRMKEVA
jgi:hypothetical protein